MATLLQLINHIGNSFDVSRMEISALKTSLALDSRRQRIRGITRRRSESNAKGACRIIGGNSTSRFCTIESHGNDSKRKLGALWTEIERHWKAIFHLRTASWLKDNREKVFCIGLWLEMRSGYSTITPRRKNTTTTTLSPVNRCHRYQQRPNIHGSKIMLCIWLDQKRVCLLAAETWRFHYGRSVSATIDLFESCEKNGRNKEFESCIARKTAW